MAASKQEDAGPPRIGGYWLLVGASVLVSGLVVAKFGEAARLEFTDVVQICAGPLLLAVGAAALAAAEFGRPLGMKALVLLTAVDLGAYGLSYAIWPQTEPLGEFVDFLHGPPDHEGAILPPRPYFREGSMNVGNQLLLAGYRRADGYSGLEPARRLDLSKTADRRLADVRWLPRGSKDPQYSGYEAKVIFGASGWPGPQSSTPVAPCRARQSSPTRPLSTKLWTCRRAIRAPWTWSTSGQDGSS